MAVAVYVVREVWEESLKHVECKTISAPLALRTCENVHFTTTYYDCLKRAVLTGTAYCCFFF